MNPPSIQLLRETGMAAWRINRTAGETRNRMAEVGSGQDTQKQKGSSGGVLSAVSARSEPCELRLRKIIFS